jgi:adenylate cyclase
MFELRLPFRSRTGKVSRRQRLILGGLGVGLGAGLLLLAFGRLPAGTALELRTLDLLFLLRGPLPPPQSIVIAAIDEDSPPVPHLRWPWPRRYHGRLLEKLRTAGAKVVAFDLLFNQPSTQEDDAAFERELALAGNVVLASDLAFRETEQVREAYSVEPLQRFAAAARAIGMVPIPTDPDQYLRSAKFTFLRRPSFALEVARVSLPQGAVRLAAGGERLMIGGKEVPVLRPGQMLINYVGPARTVTTVPFGEVLVMDAAEAREAFQDKIVLVGRAPLSIINLRKLMTDTFATPFLQSSKTYLPGIEVHANILATILERRFIAPILPAAGTLMYLAWGVLLGLAMVGVRPLVGGVLGLVAIPIPLWAAYRLFSRDLVWLPWAGLTLEVVAVYVGVLLVRYLVTEHDRAFLRRAFQYYVHPAVIEKIVAHPETLKLGGDAVYGTILFADLKGFTSFSEHLPPETLVSFLNEYLTAGTDIVIQHQGTLSRYIGDAIMALWGAPIPVADHARLACEAAMKLQQEVTKRNPEWTARGLPKFQVRIGVHTGPMVVGNVGSRERFDYTAMGDAVNLASRLERLCKSYGVWILISEATRKEVEIAVRELDLVRVVGRTEPVRVFEPLAADADLEMVRLFEQGLTAYRSRAFSQAAERFEQVLHRAPDDGPARIYRDRCRLFLREPPPPDWDGVFEPRVK